MSRRVLLALVVAVTAAACSGAPAADTGDIVLPPVDLDMFVAELEASDRPVVLNLWASWCLPCRSEAPLLRQGHAAFGEQVWFVGVATQDTPVNAAAFLAEFDLAFDNRSDPAGLVKGWAGAAGLPVTLFIRPGGEVLRTHFGVIDDRVLALGIDDLLAAG